MRGSGRTATTISTINADDLNDSDDPHGEDDPSRRCTMHRETCPMCNADMQRSRNTGGRAGVTYTCPKNYDKRKPVSPQNCPVSFVKLLYHGNTHHIDLRHIYYDCTYQVEQPSGDPYWKPNPDKGLAVPSLDAQGNYGQRRIAMIHEPNVPTTRRTRMDRRTAARTLPNLHRHTQRESQEDVQ